MKLEDIHPGCRLIGIMGESDETTVEILHTEMYGQDAVRVTYQGYEGLDQRVIRRHEEDRIREVASSSAFAFDGDPHLLQLALEAQRIRLVPHFDPYVAMDASQIDPLPHQLTAVYETMLHRHPLRFLLADDPGAGKTIMAGLLIKELLIRRTLERCLIVAPGNLVEQWQEELRDKFDLNFGIFSRDKLDASASRNPFDGYPLMIVRLDMLARDKDLMEKLENAPNWDLVVCDEAHRMSASLSGSDIKTTKRYDLGKLVGRKSHHLLLMTATPHNGKEEEFQLFMALLDEDRFGLLDEDRLGWRSWREISRVDPSDKMRRITKEEMYRLDGRMLFPERWSYTASYTLSAREIDLYEFVTVYVREQVSLVEGLGGDGRKRRNNVGFALQILQRRLASSPAAIHESLMRRKRRLEEYLQKELQERAERDSGMKISEPDLGQEPDENWFDEESGEVIEEYEEKILSNATAAQTIDDLKSEIQTLKELEEMASDLRNSGEDEKWQQLRRILDNPKVLDPHNNVRKKIVIFTEARDTLQYLADRICKLTGKGESVVVIHGGISRERRLKCIASFNGDPKVRFMLANDAAGEGVNLHHGAHLMVNYDLPWNPNRLEQRFGRIHRIGQTEVCHLWNLVAKNTREGDVYKTLLDKLESARETLGDKVYDVLGELFDSQPLDKMFMEAICYGDRADVRNRLTQKFEDAVDIDHIEELVKRNKLTKEGFDVSMIPNVRSKMERAAVRRIHPHHIRSFFWDAYRRAGGGIHKCEEGRFELPSVPQVLRDYHVKYKHGTHLPTRYERVCFEKHNATESPQASIIAPGQPLMDTLMEYTYTKNKKQLLRGAVFVDESNRFEGPRVMIVVRQIIRDGQPANIDAQNIVSQKLLYVWLGEKCHTVEHAFVPSMLGRAVKESEHDDVSKILEQTWLKEPLEKRAKEVTWKEITSGLLEEIQKKRNDELDREETAVQARFSKEIEYFENLTNKDSEKERRSSIYRRKIKDLEERQKARREEIEQQRDINAPGPEICGVAIIVPKSHLSQNGEEEEVDQHYSQEPVTRNKVEMIAIQAVMSRELASGRVPCDVSNQNLGYDLESLDGADTKMGRLLFLEVKGRKVGSGTVSITRNEMMAAYNAKDAYTLAVILVDNDSTVEQIYLQNPAQVLGPPPGLSEYIRHISIEKIRIAARQSNSAAEKVI